jgi:hypothetical protein
MIFIIYIYNINIYNIYNISFKKYNYFLNNDWLQFFTLSYALSRSVKKHLNQLIINN